MKTSVKQKTVADSSRQSSLADKATRRRGRPIDPLIRQTVLRAASQILRKRGIGAVTMEAVAEAAGVGKPTVYRLFTDRHEVAMAALMADDERQESDAELTQISKSPVRRLRHQLHQIVERFGSATGRHVASIIAAADRESEMAKAFRNHFVLARRAEGKSFLLQAIDEQEIRADINVEIVLDMLYGPLFFRLLLGHAALSGPFVDQLLSHTLRGIHEQR
jgi:AcrR family transcriptional regulator